ncbi:hypothetical protein ADUPG1_009752 [Aduncisulcus paluster]|uniref:EF-hand domain-containing protein n=1 Tax=Aduncisulcus paluster TaxID=2918883 RepID=A0ABQ5KWQ7_9EUKA|nr:hypothetical protein ADUPG1_009752 [Aduncisulcus paluster]|eukprot:gnl/Carplike_NY0171/4069_a5506_315.p1 GENE.gnl/Carplike_NY0171/4069_a5506_315~~gnl/Carplike_NY0171/4069_a5506_315.p1  ORF type:complete len:241 (-),score=38.69 gnl/Carplike_NY0171/4069_a5506_315:23-745(-)
MPLTELFGASIKYLREGFKLLAGSKGYITEQDVIDVTYTFGIVSKSSVAKILTPPSIDAISEAFRRKIITAKERNVLLRRSRDFKADPSDPKITWTQILVLLAIPQTGNPDFEVLPHVLRMISARDASDEAQRDSGVLLKKTDKPVPQLTLPYIAGYIGGHEDIQPQLTYKTLVRILNNFRKKDPKIAKQLSEQELKDELLAIFLDVDSGNNGKIDVADLELYIGKTLTDKLDAQKKMRK